MKSKEKKKEIDAVMQKAKNGISLSIQEQKILDAEYRKWENKDFGETLILATLALMVGLVAILLVLLQ